MSYAALSSELSGNLPGLSGYLADDWIKRAWRKIRDARLWSFLITDDAIVCPTQLTAGTYSIIQYNNQVTADAVASAAFLTLNPVVTPFNFMQLRFQGPATTSEIYNIEALDTSNPSALVFTLTRIVEEPTNAASGYLCYRPYIVAPVTDFLRWISVVDMENGWKLYTDRSSAAFDAIDPQRQALGQAYYMGYYKASNEAANVASLPIFELWPGPTQGQTLYVRYRRRGADFSAPDDVQPDMIPDDLILQAALGFYAYPWAMANPGQFPSFAKVNWMQLINDAKKTYMAMMIDAKRQDDNQMTQSIIRRGHGLRDASTFPYPIDASFISSHLVPL